MTHHTGLENRRSGNVTVGSNPTLSANFCGFLGDVAAPHGAPFASCSTSADGAQVGTVPDAIRDLISRGALFVINDSAGKDSQALKIRLRALVPASQLVIVHAVLPEVEWDGVPEHVERYAGDVPVIYAHATKTLFEMVEHRQMFPSPANRQCTSDLKRNPIEREIRRHLKAHPEFGGLVVNCMGMRAEESTGRSKLAPFKLNAGNSKAGREWYDWLPIHDLTEAEVFSMIADAGQEPHWAYAAGMTRLSCCFCIMASQADLTTAARLKPDLYRRYVETERRLGFTLSMSRRTLPEITGVSALPLSTRGEAR